MIYFELPVCSTLDLSFTDYDLRGYKISVVMAEKSAPRAPPASRYHSYALFYLSCGILCVLSYGFYESVRLDKNH